MSNNKRIHKHFRLSKLKNISKLTDADVQEVIGIMGEPEDYLEDDGQEYTDSGDNSRANNASNDKSLFSRL